jgi:hypothetical protein
MNPVNRDDQESAWERGWEGHERAQRRRLAQLPFPEKLKWLEDAHDLVRWVQNRTANRERAPSQAKNRFE